MTPWSVLLLTAVAAMAQPRLRPSLAAGAACLSEPEIRDAMQARRIMPPFRAVAIALREGGDLVAIRLCRAAEQALAYDVAVLRLDGRLVHVMVDADPAATQPIRRLP